ncbi:hypothetical protein M0802_010369 [Mischocyttarus mexicanus]|nr:hypothetical protein M0802_010369 [Mischocyttarus mexicanus]
MLLPSAENPTLGFLELLVPRPLLSDKDYGKVPQSMMTRRQRQRQQRRPSRRDNVEGHAPAIGVTLMFFYTRVCVCELTYRASRDNWSYYDQDKYYFA